MDYGGLAPLTKSCVLPADTKVPAHDTWLLSNASILVKRYQKLEKVLRRSCNKNQVITAKNRCAARSKNVCESNNGFSYCD
jgi:hypothetical protein